MRVYLGLLVDELADVLAAARLPERAAHGVTPALARLDPGADEEDLEFEAMCQALDAARSLGAGRRVVAAADVASRDAAAGTDGSEALLTGTSSIPLGDVVSFHVEENAGGAGSGYDDLHWYDVTELAELVSSVAG